MVGKIILCLIFKRIAFIAKDTFFAENVDISFIHLLLRRDIV